MKKLKEDMITDLKYFLLEFWLYNEIYYKTDLRLLDLSKKILIIKQKIFNQLESFEDITDENYKALLLDLTEIQENDYKKTYDLIKSSFLKLNIKIDLEGMKPEVIEKEIDKIFLKIKSLDDFTLTDIYFEVLDKIQTITSKLAFSDGIELNNKLTDFIYDFERLDDVETKQYLYEKLKSAPLSPSQKNRQ